MEQKFDKDTYPTPLSIFNPLFDNLEWRKKQ